MKKLIYLLPFVLLLTACPIGLDYAPGYVGKEAVSGNLIGTWQFQPSDELNDAEVMLMKFTKRDAFSYNATVLERGEMYSLETDELIAYETKINGLNVLYLVPSNEDKFYCQQYVLKNNKTLEVADIPLLDGGSDSIHSTESLRKQIINSMYKPEFLKEVKTYVRKD